MKSTRRDEKNWARLTSPLRGLAYVTCAFLPILSTSARSAALNDDAFVVTPPGFTKPGEVKVASGERSGRLHLQVCDRGTGELTACRLNVIGPDGNFYQPSPDRLSPYGLNGQWPKTGKGNREGKAPIRYFGRFFYSTGDVDIAVPAGGVRIEVWKGLEYRPVTKNIQIAAGETRRETIPLERTVPMAAHGYYSGDSHLHFPRQTAADDQVILDLLEAEDIHFGSILAYNEPAGSYSGVMEAMAAPQLHGLGEVSARRRGHTWIASGQEYRSATYGHLNLYWSGELALKGQKVSANNWPLYGQICRDTRRLGGFSIYAHGGYGQAIYSDFVQRNVDAVELLQFGVYRGIELDDWDRILNIGYRFPCVGASDYPACRKLGDCQTYVHLEQEAVFAAWLRGAVEGRSFVTTGPLLLLEVDGRPPGTIIRKSGTGPHSVHAKIKVRSEVAPVQSIRLVVGGKVVVDQAVPPGSGQGHWIELERDIDINESSWIAARATGKAPSGAPDAEAHTNPVYIHLNGKAPYDRDALDHLVARLDQQLAIHRKRSFPEKARVLDDFQKSRDILLRIRDTGGLPADGVPNSWIDDATAAAIDPSRRTHTDEELTRFLQPVPAKPPDQSLKTFELTDGFRMELVAAEPFVQSPVAAAFDADGNLFVAEMRDYPYKPKPGRKPLGTVRLLRDSDGDGRFDRSDVFADGLLWAAGIAPWKGGIFVTAPPDLWYLKDTDGDGKADIRKKVFTGFGTQNQQAMVNNLTWGLDHRIYGASGGNGGVIRTVGRPDAPGVSVEHNDFRFDPVTDRFEPVNGTNQFGNTFDDWGNRFICNESQPLVQAVLPRYELSRNPFLTIPSSVNNILGGSVPIFRISPIERWRQIRSSRRVAHGVRSAESAGASHHVVDAGAGVTVYRGSAYPAEYYGNVFVGDAQNNLIHRRILIPDGPTFRAVRGPREQTTEFVRSSDNWFRPVNFVNAPDGTLYALDMSRAVIEAIHIPLDVMKHLDLKQGRNQGRIYRIAPPGFHSVPPPQLSRATTPELVKALARADAWSRDTAHRLIYERQDSTAIEPLHALIPATAGALPQVRVNALWSLEGLKALRDEDLSIASSDPDAQVRAHAVQLIGKRLSRSPTLVEKLVPLAADADARVRFQVALALGESADPRVGSLLLAIAHKDATNRWIRAAVLSSCGTLAHRLIVTLWPNGSSPIPEADVPLLEPLAEIVGSRNKPADIASVVDHLAAASRHPPRVALRQRLIMLLARGLRRSGGQLVVEQNSSRPGAVVISQMISQAKEKALDSHASEVDRMEAIDGLSLLAPAESRALLVELLKPSQPKGVQIAAVKALVGGPSTDIAATLLPRLKEFEPAVRAAAVKTLLTRPNWTKDLLEAMARNEPATGITPALVELADRAPLMKHSDAAIARLAQSIFSRTAPTPRVQVIGQYAVALGQDGNKTRGAKVFERECIACHQLGGRGFALAPDLAGSPSGDSASLLANILDPNASVPPNFVQYLVIDKDGRSYTGIITAETATSLTLRRGGGAEDTILRSRIEEMTSTGLSLMPEGLEKTISKAEMADLLAFLRASHRDGANQTPSAGRRQTLDIGTLPGLIEPDH